MDKARYHWRSGSRIALDADKAGRELARLEKELHRKLTPKDVLDRARSGNSALHDHFEWDDSAAAEQYRIAQAGQLIRSIELDVSTSNLSTKTVRAFVSVEREGSRSYTTTVHAMSVPELRHQIVRKAWADFEALRLKHQGLTELAAIFSAIDQARPK